MKYNAASVGRALGWIAVHMHLDAKVGERPCNENAVARKAPIEPEFLVNKCDPHVARTIRDSG